MRAGQKRMAAERVDDGGSYECAPASRPPERLRLGCGEHLLIGHFEASLCYTFEHFLSHGLSYVDDAFLDHAAFVSSCSRNSQVPSLSANYTLQGSFTPRCDVSGSRLKSCFLAHHGERGRHHPASAPCRRYPFPERFFRRRASDGHHHYHELAASCPGEREWRTIRVTFPLRREHAYRIKHVEGAWSFSVCCYIAPPCS